MPTAITHVVDASALIAYFKGEPGHERLPNLLLDERNNLAIHAFNLCEVYYGYLRDDGLAQANEAWERSSKLLGILDIMSEDFVKRVGRWKIHRKDFPWGDSFAAASAEEHAAILLTADHGDFDAVQQAGLIHIEFIR